MIKDITGMRFGRLVAVKPTEKRSSHRSVVWECICDCGNKCEKPLSHLGIHIFSCGCLNNEVSAKNGRKDMADGTKLGNLNEKISKNNTSGIKGVCKFKNKWRAYIKINRKHIHLGVFENFNDAVKARKLAEEEYFEPILNKYGKELKP